MGNLVDTSGQEGIMDLTSAAAILIFEVEVLLLVERVLTTTMVGRMASSSSPGPAIVVALEGLLFHINGDMDLLLLDTPRWR